MGRKKHVGNSGEKEFPTKKENEEAVEFLEDEAKLKSWETLKRLMEYWKNEKPGGEKKG